MRGAISYLDFDLLVRRIEGGYRAQVLSSPAGEATADFTAPFSELELENFLLRVGRPRRGTRRIGSPEMEAVKTLGKGLYDAVFSGDVRACWRSSLSEAEAQNAGLRLRLRVGDAPELNDLPWEFLYNASLNRFLSLSEYTPLIRYLDLPERIRPLPVDARLEILVMISSPTDYPSLDVEYEWSRLNEALAGPVGSGQVRLQRLPEARLTLLQRALRRGEYHILHFIGHAGFDRETQGGLLVLRDDAGRGRLVAAEHLGTILHDHRSLRLVVLNACEGSRASRSDPFAGVAQTLVQQGVPAVIAMQFEITDQAAITFAEEFYAAVGDDHPVDAALADARKAIFASGNDIEWGTPVLYLRAPDGQLFSVYRDARRQAEEEEEERQAEAARRAGEEERQVEVARRAEEEERQAEAARRVEEEERQAEAARRVEAEERQAEAARRAEEEERQAEAARRVEEKERQAEATRLEWARRKRSVIKIAKKSAITIPAILIVGALVILAYFTITLHGPATGTLVLDGTPPGAILALDGRQIGPAKDFRQEFSAGTHVIEISANGYEPTKQTVTIVAGETLHLPLQLAPIPTPPPPSTKGTLVIDVATPGAVLTLDNKKIGPARDFHQELPAGAYFIEISADGYLPTKQTVTIVAGETLRVPIQLSLVPLAEPTKGTLVLDVTPPVAMLALDGKQIGPANGFRQELSSGAHVIEISANGYEPTKQTVTIVAGETLRVPLQLATIPPPSPPTTRGILVLHSSTPGAVLTLDGKQIGPAKDFYQELSAGTHLIEISANGYEPIKRTVTIGAGETLRVPLTLNRVHRPEQHSPGEASNRLRCNAISERSQLGESISDADRSFLRTNCQ